MRLTAGQRMELCGIDLQLRELPAEDPCVAALLARAEQLRSQDGPKPGAGARPLPTGVTLVPGPDGAAVPVTHERGADGSLRPLAGAEARRGDEPASTSGSKDEGGSASGSDVDGDNDDEDDDDEEREGSGSNDGDVSADSDWDDAPGKGKPAKGRGRAPKAPKAPKAKASGPKLVAAGIEAVLEDGSDPYAPDGGADTKDDPQAAIKERIFKMLTRGLHPDTPEAEARNAMNLVARELEKHNLEQMECMRHGSAKIEDGGSLVGGLAGVYLRPALAKAKKAEKGGGSGGKKSKTAPPAPPRGAVAVPFWANDLAGACTATFGCEVYVERKCATTTHDGTTRWVFYGLLLDSRLAAFAYATAFNRIALQAANYAPVAGASCSGESSSERAARTRKARSSFALGCASRLQKGAKQDADRREAEAKAAEKEAAEAEERARQLEAAAAAAAAAVNAAAREGARAAAETARAAATSARAFSRPSRTSAAVKTEVEAAFGAVKVEPGLEDVGSDGDDGGYGWGGGGGGGGGGDDSDDEGAEGGGGSGGRAGARAAAGAAAQAAAAAHAASAEAARTDADRARSHLDASQALVVHKGKVGKDTLAKANVGKLRAGRKRVLAPVNSDAWKDGEEFAKDIDLKRAKEKCLTRAP